MTATGDGPALRLRGVRKVYSSGPAIARLFPSESAVGIASASIGLFASAVAVSRPTALTAASRTGPR